MATALAGGVAVALGLVAVTIGTRPDLSTALSRPDVLVKMLFVALVLTGAGLLASAAGRPGKRPVAGLAVLAAAVALALSAAALDLAGLDPAAWPMRIMGKNWMSCLGLIPVYALPAMALVAAGLRRLAPTDPARAGLCMGLAGGAAGAMAYALHCTDDAAPFFATWYVAALALSALVGRVLGPRVLRW
jgi:hypothetical protein